VLTISETQQIDPKVGTTTSATIVVRSGLGLLRLRYCLHLHTNNSKVRRG
jgi:hypothetical protein